MFPANLVSLARQAAAGDAEARHTFECQIVPLIETVVRRWLRQQHRERCRQPGGRPAAGEDASLSVSADELRRITSTVCARLIRQFLSPSRGVARPGDETIVFGQLLDTLVGGPLPATG